MSVNLPKTFEKQMQEILGAEYDAFYKSYEENNILSLRVNPLKIKEDIKEAFPTAKETVKWENAGRYYEETDTPGKHPYHNAGVYYIQEASAMAPVHYLMEGAGEEERILDLCAAPGGKTTQIAGYMKGRGLLVANEIIPKRARILSENIERMGVSNAIVINHDPLDLKDRFGGFFTRILVDAPCSGEGMFRKHPEAMDEWSLENVEICAKRQDYILDCAAHMLKAGGRLVYSTCTYNDKEDEGSVRRFLERHPEFDTVEEGIHIYPHKEKGEGHFLAVFEKSAAADASVKAAISGDYDEYLRAVFERVLLADDEAAEFVKDNIILDYVNENEALDGCRHSDNEVGLHKIINRKIIRFGENIYLAPEDMPDIKGLKVLRPGLHIGTVTKNRFEPSHALALILRPYMVNNVIRLSTEEAQSYLKGMTINDERTAALKKGWCLVCCGGYSLGWGKIAGGVLKNHYPKGLRIL